MSPSWRDELRLYAAPNRVIGARARGWPRRSVVLKQTYAAPGEEGSWRGMLSALDQALGEMAGGAGRATLVLSNHFVHAQLIAGRADLSSEAEHAAFARHCLVQVFGEAVEQWEVRASYERPGAPRVACAVDPALLSEIAARFDERRLALYSVQPLLMAAFNTWRRQLKGRAAWFAIAEPGRLLLAHVDGSEWRWLRSLRVDEDWALELPRLVAREAQLSGVAADNAVLLAYCPDNALLSVPTGGLSVKQLQLAPLPGFSPVTDSAYGYALVG